MIQTRVLLADNQAKRKEKQRNLVQKTKNMIRNTSTILLVSKNWKGIYAIRTQPSLEYQDPYTELPASTTTKHLNTIPSTNASP